MGFDIALVGHAGRIGVEAALLVASLRRADPDFAGRVIVMEPSGPLWPKDPSIGPEARGALERCGAQIVRFENRHFGAAYPHGNKIEGLAATVNGPTLFLDSDTLVMDRIGDVPFTQPTASLHRTATWPKPGTEPAVWPALYERFGIDIGPTLDTTYPPEDWRRYLYLNAGWIFVPDRAFAQTWSRIAAEVWRDPGPALEGQSLTPWLDQATLPLALAAHGGGRPDASLAGMDTEVTRHWRVLALLYAQMPDAVVDRLEELAALPWLKKALRMEEAFRKMVYQGRGAKARALYGPGNVPYDPGALRKALKAAGLWIR